MEFSEKLQSLRKQKELTQEELAQALYVSRTAISKWESGRGYPSIDSLKAISRFFSVTIDDLLSGEEVLLLAEETQKQQEQSFCALISGLLDCGMVLFFFLPLFCQNVGDAMQPVSLLGLTGIQPYLKVAYTAILSMSVVLGILTLALQNHGDARLIQRRGRHSFLCHIVGTLLFILGRQPYAAAFSFVFLLIKAGIQLKKQ